MESIVPGAIDSAPSLGDEKREEGAIYLRQGHFADAVDALREATGINPADDGAWRLLGGAFASQGDYDRAAAAFQQAILLAPTNARNSYNLGLALEALDRPREAREAFEQALNNDPAYEAARTRLTALGGSVDEGLLSKPPPASVTPPQMPADLERTLVDIQSPLTSSPASALDRPTYDAPSPARLSDTGFAPEPAISAFPPAGGSYVPQPILGHGYDVNTNNSGMQAGAPPEVAGGWNWGAFFLSWIWLLNHGQVGFGIGMLFAGLVPIVQLGLQIYLGIKGNELGWSNRRFQSVADFQACQKIWAKWALAAFIVNFICVVLWIVIVIAAAASKAGNSQ